MLIGFDKTFACFIAENTLSRESSPAKRVHQQAEHCSELQASSLVSCLDVACGLFEKNGRRECTTARYEVAWSDRYGRPAVQQADARRVVVDYATLDADGVAGAIRPDPEARIGEDRGIREGRDIVGSSLHANTTAIEGDQRVINEGMAAKRATR